MDWVVLVMLALGAFGAAALFGGGDEEVPGVEGASPEGEGGYGPDGAHDAIWGTSESNLLEGNEPVGMGIEFEKLDDGCRERLEKFLAGI